MAVVIKIIGLDTGQMTPYDGCYLAAYDVGVDGFDHNGARLSARVEAYPDIRRAMKFNDLTDALECYKKIDPKVPVRQDGKPNRPLTAFTIQVLPYIDPGMN